MSNIFSIILGISGSVALFLYSVFTFSNLVKNLATLKVKNLLSSLTSNPPKGLIFGAITAAILQSGSAISVILASLADAGLISFYNSLGIIFGINLGAVITSQLVAFNVMSISPFIILLGLILHYWGNGFKKYSKLIIYFGLLFFSIYLISIFVSYINQDFFSSILSFTSNPFLAILVGLIATIIFQSSGVVSGIILVLASAGHIDLTQAVGLILGTNIGTTSTVILASLAMGKEAKKVALSHFLFNLIGVIILFPFLNYFYLIIRWFDGGLVHQIANIHLLFNLVCALLFLLLIKPFASLINNIIK